MRLYYRGTGYDLDPSTLEIPESSVTGYYRGHAFNLQYPKHISVPQPGRNLNYRGTAYRVLATGEIEALAGASTKRVTAVLSPLRSSRQSLAEVHRNNIHRSLQHRLEVARASGDRYLIQQLEQEMHQVVS
jgi:Domain of unknown function (DUF4278)